MREELPRSLEVEVSRSYTQVVREELRRLQEVEVERTRPITQPHKISVPERIKAVATNKQMSVMKPMDKPRCKMRLGQEGSRGRPIREFSTGTSNQQF